MLKIRLPSTLTHPLYSKWWQLIIFSIGSAMLLFSQTAVSIALPKIQREFQLSPSALQWIINSYLLTTAVCYLMGGYLGGRFQYRRIYLIGLFVFFIASIICAISLNIEFLMVGRILQGLGAALILPNITVIIIELFEEKNKGTAMGVYLGSMLFAHRGLTYGLGLLCNKAYFWCIRQAYNLSAH
jgi:MFS family permease